MRSRDGNRTFSLYVCSLILFSFLNLQASEEYLISYRYVVKDALLYNEDLSISHAMKKCSGSEGKSLTLSASGHNLKKTISQNSDIFIEYIHKLGLDVAYQSTNTNLQNSSTTILTLKTTCFKVDFNDNFAKITSLK